MKEMQAVNREAQWTEDKVVAACRQCERPFSVSRRKVQYRLIAKLFFNHTNRIYKHIFKQKKAINDIQLLLNN